MMVQARIDRIVGLLGRVKKYDEGKCESHFR